MAKNEGIILIDKAIGWSSFDCVAKIRSLLVVKSAKYQALTTNKQRIRVGHTGTLDPFATGLLIILVESETKNQANYMKLDKVYEATLCLGSTSSTGDPEGAIKTKINNQPAVAVKNIKKVISSFIGEINQTPPQFSAIKINGQRAYQLARQNIKVELKPRKIQIYEIKLLEYCWPSLTIKVSCSSGTYLRTLAEDIGQKLNCGAYLTALRRLKIGDFSVSQAQTITEFAETNT